MNIRCKAAIVAVIQFICFSILTLFLLLALFKLAVFAFPVFAFMWTFFFFSALAIITGVRVWKKDVVLFAVFHFVFIVLLLAFLLYNASEQKKGSLFAGIITVASLALIGYIWVIIKTWKKYLPLLKKELEKITHANERL